MLLVWPVKLLLKLSVQFFSVNYVFLVLRLDFKSSQIEFIMEIFDLGFQMEILFD